MITWIRLSKFRQIFLILHLFFIIHVSANDTHEHQEKLQPLRSVARQDIHRTSWDVSIAEEYQILGPFAQEAREQYVLSPGYPLGFSHLPNLKLTKSYPSHLVDEGFVSWKNESRRPQPSAGDLKPASRGDSRNHSLIEYSVSFPEVRWDSIRATEGWSGLQHHALLRTSVEIATPQPENLSRGPVLAYLLFSARQCSQIAVIDESSNIIPRWHTGNIYDYSDAPFIRIPLIFCGNSDDCDSIRHLADSAEPITIRAGKSKRLVVFLGLDYEIRLFGDPLFTEDSNLPIIRASLGVSLEFGNEHTSSVAEPASETTLYDNQNDFLLPSLLYDSGHSKSCLIIPSPADHIVPHFSDGWAYGDVIGIRVTSCSHQDWTIQRVTMEANGADDFMVLETGISLSVPEPIRLIPSQARALLLEIKQSHPLSSAVRSLNIILHLVSGETTHTQREGTMMTSIPVVHYKSPPDPSTQDHGLLMTYISVSNIAASAVVIPPNPANLTTRPHDRVLLALHGAGVMHTHPLWLSALPRLTNTWILVVQGLTPWGLDWRQASRADVCAALRTLILKLAGVWHEEDYCSAHDWIGFVGHRGLARRLVIPVIAIGHSNGGQGTLHLASLFPDSIPALIPAAGYTSARLYVSTQHSRGSLFADAALQGIMGASLQGQDGDIIAGNLALSRVLLVHGGDDENVPVWHSRERLALIKSWNPGADVSFIEAPGKPHVWPTVFLDEPVYRKISELVASPYSTLRSNQAAFVFTVVWPSESGSMKGWRVRELAIPGRLARIHVDGSHVRTTNTYGLSVNILKANVTAHQVEIDGHQITLPAGPTVWLRRNKYNRWEISHPFEPYPSGPLSRILTSPGTISIVIPSGPNGYFKSLALRLANSLMTYLNLDCAILDDQEGLSKSLTHGNVVVIGGTMNTYGLKVRSSPLKVLADGSISIMGDAYSQPETAALSLHQNHLYMDAVDEAGYERALRAFPLRTGVPGPEWMIFGEPCNLQGYGGVYAAGFWDRKGEFSEVMSYFN